MSGTPTSGGSQERGRGERRRERTRPLVPVLCLVVVLAVFAPSLATGTFVNGSDSILRLPLLSHFRNIPTIFGRDFMVFTDGQYRPLSYALVAAVRTFVGVDATLFWHTWLVAFHALNALLVYTVARRFAKHAVSAFLAGGVFLLHPLASIFGNQMNQFHHVLATAIYLGTLLCYVRFIRTRRKGSYLLGLLLFAAGLLTSKVVLTLPLLIVVLEIFYERRSLRAVVARSVPFAALILLSAPCWFWLTPNELFYHYPRYYPGVGWYSFCSVVGAGGHMALGLLGGQGILAPLHETVEHLTSVLDWRFILCGLAVLPAAILSLWGMLRKRWVGLGVILIGVSLIPYASTAVNVVDEFISWNYLYLPLAGFALVLGGLMDLAAVSISGRARRVVTAVVALFVLVPYTSLLVVDNVQTRSALSYWRAVLTINGRSEIAWVKLGKAYLAGGDETKALQCLFRPSVKFIPTSCLAMSRHYLRKGEVLSAAVHMRYGVNAPAAGYMSHIEALGVLGDLTRALGTIDYSEDCLARTLMLNRYDTAAMRKLAPLLADKGYVRASVRWVERAVELEPGDARNHKILLELRRRRYASDAPPPLMVVTPEPSDRLRYASAGPTSVPLRKRIVQLAEHHPKDPVIQMASGVCLVQEGENERAFEKFSMATRWLASYAYAWAAKCYVAKELSRDDDAIQAGYRAHDLDPKNASVLNDLGFVLARKGKLTEARDCYLASLRREVDNRETHNRLGALLIRLQDYAGAVRHFQTTIRLGLETANIHNNLGFALDELGQHERALTHFRKAVALDPKDVRTHRGLANALLARGKLTESREALLVGLERFPEDIVLSAALAWILAAAPDERLRDGEQAVRVAEAACTKATPVSSELLDALAAAYAEVGRFSKAAEIARKAVAAAHAERKSLFARLIEQRRRLYEQRRPYRMSPPTDRP